LFFWGLRRFSLRCFLFHVQEFNVQNSVVKDSLTTAADGKNYLSSLLALVSGEKQCAKFAFLLFAICEGFLILLRF
jgi:hypothetical protein